MSVPNSPQCQLVSDWNKGFETKDLHTLGKYLHKDYRNVIYPRSLNRAEKSREEWLAYIARLFPHWPAHKDTLRFVADVPGKVIVHTQLTDTESNTVYDALSIVHIITDDDGNLKIIKTEKFIDSKAYHDAVAKIGGGL